MTPDTNLHFIQKKISELRTAVMYSMSKSLVKLPNDIVTYVKVDEDDQLWFLSHSPSHSIRECEQVFPARLHFFRKGCDFFVEVSGRATILDKISLGEASGMNDINNDKDTVLIRMTMSNIEYREPHAKKTKTKLELLAEKSYQWIRRAARVHPTESPEFSKLHQHH